MSVLVGERRRLALPLPSLRWPKVADWPASLRVGGGVLLFWVLLSLVAPLILPYGPETVVYGKKLQPPSGEFLFGSDPTGRDVLARVVYSFRYDVLIAVGGVAMAITGGILLGSVAASARAIVDDAIMRALDVVSAFPSFVLALTLAAALGANLLNVVIAIGIVYVPHYARLVRAQMMAERSKQYCEAAHCMGLPRRRIVFVHLLPNSLSAVITQAAMNVATSMMIAAGISYLGFGVRPPAPEWGLMISEGASYIVSGQWWVAVFPGLAIISVVTSCILLDDGLRQKLKLS